MIICVVAATLCTVTNAENKHKKKPCIMGVFNSVDLGEKKNNLADQHPEIVARLQKVYDDLKADIKKNARPRGE